MIRMINSDYAKSVMVDMEYGHVIFFEKWTFICDGMCQCSSNCGFVALVMTTMAISLIVAECMVFMDVRNCIAYCNITLAIGSLTSKPAETQEHRRLTINKQLTVAIINSCHHQPQRGSI